MMISETARTRIIELCRTTDDSIEAIAKAVGVCPDTVSKVIRDHGKPRTIKTPKDPETAVYCTHCKCHVKPTHINKVGWIPCLEEYLEISQVFRY